VKKRECIPDELGWFHDCTNPLPQLKRRRSSTKHYSQGSHDSVLRWDESAELREDMYRNTSFLTSPQFHILALRKSWILITHVFIAVPRFDRDCEEKKCHLQILHVYLHAEVDKGRSRVLEKATATWAQVSKFRVAEDLIVFGEEQRSRPFAAPLRGECPYRLARCTMRRRYACRMSRFLYAR
jgi:hypothetical protein